MHCLVPNGLDVLDDQPLPPRPRLVHSRRHGLAGEVVTQREITLEECPWLEAPLPQGTRLNVYTGYTYGAIGRQGIAVTHLDAAAESTFFEVPASALVSEQ